MLHCIFLILIVFRVLVGKFLDDVKPFIMSIIDKRKLYRFRVVVGIFVGTVFIFCGYLSYIPL